MSQASSDRDMTRALQKALPGPVIAIVGATASGKSAVADLVAADLDTSVISVDAMQVYRGMDIGTAKTPPDERAVPLQMVDVANPGEPFSVALYQEKGRACIDRALKDQGVAVLCGGTGLYLDALINQMSFPKGELESTARKRYEAIADEKGAQALWQVLFERDPRSAEAIHPNNTRRVVRALEMADLGVSYAEQRAKLKTVAPFYDATIWELTWERDVLYKRIDARVDQMFAAGLVEEVQALLAAGFREALSAQQAIGYKEVVQALDGIITMDEARAAIKQATRRYAKRQISWIKRDGRARKLDMQSMRPEDAAEIILREYRRAKAAELANQTEG